MSEEEKLSLREMKDSIRKDSKKALAANIGTSVAILALFLTMFLQVTSSQQEIIKELSKNKLEMLDFINDNFVTKGAYQSMTKMEHRYDIEAVKNPVKSDSIYREHLDELAWEFDILTFRGETYNPF